MRGAMGTSMCLNGGRRFTICTGDMLQSIKRAKIRHVNFLDWWKTSALEFRWTVSAIDHASSYGKIELLDWLKAKRLALKYLSDAMDWETNKGKVDVLEWWTDRFACTRVTALEWWKASRLELRFSNDSIDEASREVRLDTLNGESRGLEMKWTLQAVESAKELVSFVVLDWWKHCGLEMDGPLLFTRWWEESLMNHSRP
ncbi:hypothetical protein BJ742DRAFT_776547 [Cladochytrium replicatum]|nr:hypothetical protein BJ742DRAFT_776547 [Cladochytrium replicatum]